MEIAMLIIGIFLGGSIATGLLCCLQIHRHNEYEKELRRLKSKLYKD